MVRTPQRRQSRTPSGAEPSGDRSGDGCTLRAPIFNALRELVAGATDALRLGRADGALATPVPDAADLVALRDRLVGTLFRIVVLAFAEAHGLSPKDGRGRAAAQIEAELAILRGPGLLLGDVTLDRVLEHILFVDGKPIRYVDLEVEEIGAAYEGVIGFELRLSRGPTLVLLPDHQGVDLHDLLATPGLDRAERLLQKAAVTVRPRLAAALAAADSVDALASALCRRRSTLYPEVLAPGSLYLEPGPEQRRTGSHYTPRSLTKPLVAATLAPLLDRAGREARLETLLDLRVCDASMGGGAFLVEACRQLGHRVAQALRACGSGALDFDPEVRARRLVAEHCVFGVDQNPVAVELARVSVWLVAATPELSLDFAHDHLRQGDALIGAVASDDPSRDAISELTRAEAIPPFHWHEAFPSVFGRSEPGFDVFLGNPPWVAYAGRAAQPLARRRFDFYLRHFPGFRRYRTLHGLFIQRCASLLRPGGRMGLVVPTSVSDLDGYEPTRRAHDALATVDPELPDFGNAFVGVFQPSMGLISTRKLVGAGDATPANVTWRVARSDVDTTAEALILRLVTLPLFPPECFGERGFQTSGTDVARLAETGQPTPPFIVPIREGADINAFRTAPPRLHLDPTGLLGKLRSEGDFGEVKVLVRQTARFPVAALADGLAFRNSILACFGAEGHPASTILAYLNSSPVRWLHYMRFRDARQGMPQVKIRHLRATPRPPEGRHCAELQALGEALGRANDGISDSEQRHLDNVVADAFDLSQAERSLIAEWADRNPAP